ncbi:ComEC/Rec2 family competence protein [Planctomycetota bacterium]
MSKLRATMIDVGWGDSILLEVEDDVGTLQVALVDSNDKKNFCSSLVFLSKHFQRCRNRLPSTKPMFEFVMLSHAHADHGDGLKAIMQKFGTKELWYPKTDETKPSILTDLQSFARRSSNVRHWQALDVSRQPHPLGPANLRVLWPLEDGIDTDNENNNSIVFTITLDQVTFVLTGDAEKDVWEQIASQVPQETHFFKVPHHGSVNGTLGSGGATPWLDHCPNSARLGISCHGVRFGHPHDEVVKAFEDNGWAAESGHFRTDQHYHLTFETDGQNTTVQYSRV